MKYATKFLGFFMLLFVFGLTFGSKASAGSYDSDIETVDLPYDGEEYAGLTPRSIEYVPLGREITFHVDGKSFAFTTSDDLISACGDVNGTFWYTTYTTDKVKKLYWLNYEVEGDNMTPHFFINGSLWYTNYKTDYVGAYEPTGASDLIDVPTPVELKKLISPSTPVPTETPAAPVPTQAATPVPTQTPGNVVPTQAPSTQASTQNIQKAKVTNKISKTKLSKTKVTLLSTTGKVLKSVKFSKKTGIMVYNNKKVKNVKAVFFTKKGNIVYLTKNKKAYYFNGKKSTLIKRKVSSIKTSKKFATHLVLQNKKKVLLKK